MPRYIVLVDWTQEGVQAVEQTVDRLEQGSARAVARAGNLRTTTLRAWTADEMREIVGRLAG
jgi:uncharacterized protein with GYD domain